jgi:GT2 family glycosyltransferase
MILGAVAIGRNEGDRLKRCLSAIKDVARTIYVDSGSTDGSIEWTLRQGIEVLELDRNQPFTAGRARNAGFVKLKATYADLRYVQFVDGDCEICADWLDLAMAHLEANPKIAVVCGRLRERQVEHSIYNWLCDREWQGPVGEIRECGGIAMMRVAAFETVRGFREDLIAGEEPDLCVRLRASGWRVWRLDSNMAVHDAAMTKFSQWWHRSTRTGYAYAQGAYLHGKWPERHKVWESRRAWIWSLWLPLACILASITFRPWGWLTWSIYPLQIIRQAIRNQGSWTERFLLAFFHLAMRLPECVGQLMFWRDIVMKRQRGLIEYK